VRSCDGSDRHSAPRADQLEFCFFGPGFGESILAHVGDGFWILIDSCRLPKRELTQPIAYLRSVGVDPSSAVKLVIATHWHDDHIKGMADVVKECANATFVCSQALKANEFQQMIYAYQDQPLIAAGSGVQEIANVFKALVTADRVVREACSGRPLLTIPETETSHGCAVRVTALSPSDGEIQASRINLAALMPTHRTQQIRCPPEDPNLMSVAVAIDVGGISALLGADLENSADDNRGWGAILTDKNLPTNQSIIFKIPHHGSQNAHHAEVWQTLLCKDPISIVTPWRRGGRELPTTSDVGRIRAHSPHAFMTSSTDAALSKINRPQIVRRQLREMGARIERMYGTEGVIRIRNGGPPDWHSWDVCLRDGASVL
jgi:beta-lactamase superfamily II metal-dependent hydrolase